MSVQTEVAKYDIRDIRLADEGKRRTEWSERSMPVLRQIRARFAKEKPLKGARLSACLHVTTETANLMITLRAAGAEIALCASNPLSTQDDVAAHLVRDHGVHVYAIKGEDNEKYYTHIAQALAFGPDMTQDDGADLVGSLHMIALNRLDDLAPPIRKWVETLSPDERRALVGGVRGSTEETTTGVIRLKAMAKEGVLQFPIVAVNDSDTKHMFDNRYGTGQSTLDGIVRATNLLLAGSTVVVAGYGWCGRGVAMRARGAGGHVIVTEVDPVSRPRGPDGRLRGPPDGRRGRHRRPLHHPDRQHPRDPGGALLGHEGRRDRLQLRPLQRRAGSGRARDASRRSGGWSGTWSRSTWSRAGAIMVLGEGRLINLAAAEGHPASVMDMSFANQALAAELLAKESETLAKAVHRLPASVDQEIARLKLQSMGIAIDTLTAEQVEYLASWDAGT